MKKAKHIALAFTTIFLLTSVLSLRAYTIAGPSMSPSYWLNDIVIANHNAYLLGNPKRGDAIVYFDSAKNSVAVKRIIGIPEDRVQLFENVVSINGTELKQTSKSREDFSHVPEENGIGQVITEENVFGETHLITFTPMLNPERSHEAPVLKENEYFILGDHRDNSADSRYIGPIHRDQIIGKIIFRVHQGTE